jgi:activator of HSP90 ATPase
MTKTIRQTALFRAPPRQVYAALLDSRQHTAFTGNKAKIVGKVGGAFSCYGGYITGVTLELAPNQRIVQAWRSRDWPKGGYSIVTFALAKAAGGKTKLSFTQLGVPAGDFKAKSQGWKSHYWQPLKAFLEK